MNSQNQNQNALPMEDPNKRKAESPTKNPNKRHNTQTSSTSLCTESQFDQLLNCIKNTKIELNTTINEVKTEILSNQQFLSCKFEQFDKKFKQFSTDHKQIRKDVNELKIEQNSQAQII